MLELNVNSRLPGAITSAIKKIKEMTTSGGSVQKSTVVHIVLEAGVYRETVKYNLSNPLIIETAPGVKPGECIIQADNCESFNKGIDNRGIFLLGPNVTTVNLKGFNVVNTHAKSATSSIQEAGEVLYFNNTAGTLTCENMTFTGHANVATLKGNSRFTRCRFEGDSDIICGEPEVALFESCEIFLKEDPGVEGVVCSVKSSAIANKPGFVFTDCVFTAEKRKKSELFPCGTFGKGSADSPKFWDSIAFINCAISDLFSPELAWDDDMNLNLYPRGNAKTGIREYNPKSLDKNNKVTAAETVRRNVKSYTITDDDYYNGYCSRYMILKDTPFYN